MKEFFNRLFNSMKSARESGQGSDLISAAPGILQAGDAAFRREKLNKEINAPGITSDVFGQPIYNQEEFIKSNKNFRQEIKGTVGRGILQGTMGGVQAGASLGGAKGALVGGAIGALGGLFGGKARRKQLLREANRREDESRAGVERFNDASERFRENVEADDFTKSLLNRRNSL